MFVSSFKDLLEAFKLPAVGNFAGAWLFFDFSPRPSTRQSLLRSELHRLSPQQRRCRPGLGGHLGGARLDVRLRLSRVDFRGKRDLFFWIISTRMAPVVAVMCRSTRSSGTPSSSAPCPGSSSPTRLQPPLRDLDPQGLLRQCALRHRGGADVRRATRFQAFRSILPLVAPGIGAFLVLCVLFAWNDFLFASIIGSGRAKTLPVATRELVQPQNIQWGSRRPGHDDRAHDVPRSSHPALPGHRANHGRGARVSHGIRHDLRGVEILRQDRRREGSQHRVPGWRVHVDPGPLGLRQVLDPAHAGCRLRHPFRWQAHQRPAAQGSRHRDGVRELRPLPAQDGAREHRQPAALRGTTRARSRAKVREAAGCSRSSTCSTAGRWSSRAGRSSAWRSAGRSCGSRSSSCSTSRSPISTPSCAPTCAASSS